MSDQSKLHEDKLFADFPACTYAAWKEQAEASLKGAPFEKVLHTRTPEGIELRPLYHKKDLEELPHLTRSSISLATTAGRRPAGPPNTWWVRQRFAAVEPAEFNRILKQDLARGQDSFAFALDRWSRRGADPLTTGSAEANLSQQAYLDTCFSHIKLVSRLFEDVDLRDIPLAIDPGSSSVQTVAMLLALCQRYDWLPSRLRLDLETDFFSQLALTGSLPRPFAVLIPPLAELFQLADEERADWGLLRVSGICWHEAGASAVQELALVLAAGAENFRLLGDAGISLDTVARRTRMSLGVGRDLFMQIAKIRAARLLWSNLCSGFEVDASHHQIPIHVQGSSVYHTKRDPWTNLLRDTVQAFAGAVGGADSMHCSTMADGLGVPSDFHRRMARNTQVILKEEAHLDKVLDPAAGSWYIENLCDSLARNAWERFQEIEQLGGLFAAMRRGVPQQWMAASREDRRARIANRRQVIVGTNKYPLLNEEAVVFEEPSTEKLRKITTRDQQKPRGDQYRKELQFAEDQTGTARIRQLARAASAGASLHELSEVIWPGSLDDGLTEAVTPLVLQRASEELELLRDQADQWLADNGSRPSVFLANMGPLRQHKARADFSRGFLECGGFDVLSPKGFETPEEAAQAAVDSSACAVVLCSTDDSYPELTAPFVEALRTLEQKAGQKKRLVLLAGYPKGQIEALSEAGVEEFIHLKADLPSVLDHLFNRLGVQS